MSEFYFAEGDGTISAPGEVDLYAVELTGGVTYAAHVSGVSTGGGTLPDPAVYLVDEYGNVLGGQDDFYFVQWGYDPYWEFEAPYTGSYYIGATDLYGGTGSYTVELIDVASNYGF